MKCEPEAEDQDHQCDTTGIQSEGTGRSRTEWFVVVPGSPLPARYGCASTVHQSKHFSRKEEVLVQYREYV